MVMVNESDHDTAFVELRAVPAQLTALSVELSPLPLNRTLRVLLRPGEFAMIKHLELRGGAHSKAVKVRAACIHGPRTRLPSQPFLRFKLRTYKDGTENKAADIRSGGFITKKVVRWQDDKRKGVAEKKLNGGVTWSAADQELFRHRAGRLRRGKKSATDSQLLAAAGIAAPSSSKTHAAPRPPVAFFVRKRRRRRRQRGGEGAAPPAAEAAAEAAPAPAERSRRRGQRRGVVEYRKIGWSDVEESLQERFKKELEADSSKQLLSVLALDSGNVVFQAGILVTPESVYQVMFGQEFRRRMKRWQRLLDEKQSSWALCPSAEGRAKIAMEMGVLRRKLKKLQRSVRPRALCRIISGRYRWGARSATDDEAVHLPPCGACTCHARLSVCIHSFRRAFFAAPCSDDIGGHRHGRCHSARTARGREARQEEEGGAYSGQRYALSGTLRLHRAARSPGGERGRDGDSPAA